MGVVKALLDHGASLDLRSRGDNTALYNAWRQSTNKVYSAMAEQYKEHFTLHHLDKM